MLIGAYDSETLYSNYCNDMVFYYEHGYHKFFPEFENVLEEAYLDPHALLTPGGRERRLASKASLMYTKTKMAFETVHKATLSGKTARLNREDILLVNLCENEIWGMAAEAIARGFNKASVVNDFIFSSPNTDVIDVGSDLNNSELFNSFLVTADIAELGIITDHGLRRVYDAYAHSCARMYTERFLDPSTKMNAAFLTWHILNNRHELLRRMVLGYPRVRKTFPDHQYEADFGDVFDTDCRTTGFKRPMAGACNGELLCDHVEKKLQHQSERRLLSDLWWLLSTGLLEYASSCIVSIEIEERLRERLAICLATCYSHGLVDEMSWLLAHANQHAWQVNYLFEAAMFGSLLEDGTLKGRLDRYE